MWKDPIIADLRRVRAAIAAKHPGLEALHDHALQVQEEARARGVPIVSLRKATRRRKHRIHDHRACAARKAVG